MFSFLKGRKKERHVASKPKVEAPARRGQMSSTADNLFRLAMDSMNSSIESTRDAKKSAQRLHKVVKELTFAHTPATDVNK